MGQHYEGMNYIFDCYPKTGENGKSFKERPEGRQTGETLYEFNVAQDPYAAIT